VAFPGVPPVKYRVEPEMLVLVIMLELGIYGYIVAGRIAVAGAVNGDG